MLPIYAYTKAQISFAVTAQLISAFVFATAQAGLCETWSETQRRVFSRRGSNIAYSKIDSVNDISI